MAIRTKDLVESFLVVHRCRRFGGVHYTHQDEESSREGNREVSAWRAEKIVDDVEELKAAQKIQRLCKSAFGSLGATLDAGFFVIPAEREEEIVALDREWQETIREFNSNAKFISLDHFVVRVSARGENERALGTLLKQLRVTLSDLKAALESAEPKSIREVLVKLKGYNELLPENARSALESAMKNARQQARSITKQVKEINETASSKEELVSQMEEVRESIDFSPIDLARFVVDPIEEDDESDAPTIGEELSARFADSSM